MMVVVGTKLCRCSGKQRIHIGEKLVLDCIEQGRLHGFGGLQFNVVVATNIHARHLYERRGFVQLGTIPKGFQMKNGQYGDICPYYLLYKFRLIKFHTIEATFLIEGKFRTCKYK